MKEDKFEWQEGNLEITHVPKKLTSEEYEKIKKPGPGGSVTESPKQGVTVQGGGGSGNFGHSGRPGAVGGSGGGGILSSDSSFSEFKATFSKTFPNAKLGVTQAQYEGLVKEGLNNQLNEAQSIKDRFPKVAKIWDEQVKNFNLISKEQEESKMVGYWFSGKGEVAVGFPEGMKLNESSLVMGGFNVGNANAVAVARHELGHAFYYSDKSGTQMDLMGTKIATVELQKLQVKYETARGSKISGYAKTNEMELFAESFSAYTSSNYRQGQLPRDVESYMEKILGSK